MYRVAGRPSIPPERLLKASLLISLYSVRSERAFCEQLNYDLLWRWFLDMALMEPSFDQSTFSNNRGRLLKHAVAQQFVDGVIRQADTLGLLSDEHFTVDGTQMEGAASLKSFKPKDKPPPDQPPPDDPGNPTVNFRGEKRSNARIRARRIPKRVSPRRAAASSRSWLTGLVAHVASGRQSASVRTRRRHRESEARAVRVGRRSGGGR